MAWIVDGKSMAWRVDGVANRWRGNTERHDPRSARRQVPFAEAKKRKGPAFAPACAVKSRACDLSVADVRRAWPIDTPPRGSGSGHAGQAPRGRDASDYFTICARSPLLYFSAILSRATGLILPACPSQPNDR